VGAQLTRIISDVHYGERGSRVRSLGQLRPLLDGATSFVINGDALDTRPGRNPQRTSRMRREVLEFFGSAGMPVTFLTGNHDADLSERHEMEFAGGRILVIHGDVLFDDIVPWSRDAPVIRARIKAALAALPEGEARSLEGRLAAFRSVAASTPQLHQSETNPFRYAFRLASDSVWPPQRALAVLRAWREAPERAAALAREHRPRTRFVIMGHTHRAGIRRTASGITVINTGCFCSPSSALAAEVFPDGLRVRRVERRGDGFHPGPCVAEYSLP
jgi:UDP-2,3-diacylglucosamine pyrophosphatase LpxH